VAGAVERPGGHGLGARWKQRVRSVRPGGEQGDDGRGRAGETGVDCAPPGGRARGGGGPPPPPHTLWVLCNLVKFKKHTQNLYRPPRRRYRFWGRQL
jgi:hypothetical protein